MYCIEARRISQTADVYLVNYCTDLVKVRAERDNKIAEEQTQKDVAQRAVN